MKKYCKQIRIEDTIEKSIALERKGKERKYENLQYGNCMTFIARRMAFVRFSRTIVYFDTI